jgi:hypothetical protein
LDFAIEQTIRSKAVARCACHRTPKLEEPAQKIEEQRQDE